MKSPHTFRRLSRRSAAEPVPSCCGASGAPSSCPFPASGRITLQWQPWLPFLPRMVGVVCALQPCNSQAAHHCAGVGDAVVWRPLHLRCFLGSVTLTAPLSAAALSDLMGYPAHSCPAGGSQSHVNLHSKPCHLQ